MVVIEDHESFSDIVRNISIVCPSGFDKKGILDSILSAPGTVPEKPTSECLRCESDDLSIEYKMGNKGNFLINIIDALVDTDHSKANNVLSVADGALLIAREGCDIRHKEVLRSIITGRIKPVLAIDTLNAWFETGRCHEDGESAYAGICNVIENVNEAMKAYPDKILGDIKFCLQEGNVALISSVHQWGFTLPSLAKLLAKSTSTDEASVLSQLCEEKGFVQMCYLKIKSTMDLCMTDLKKMYDSLQKQGVKFGTDKRKALRKASGQERLKLLMRTYMSSGKTLLEMLITHLPSPAKAQMSRVENLYKGPLNDKYANSIRTASTLGPLVVLMCKIVVLVGTGKRLAVCRILSGSLATGRKVRIVTDNQREEISFEIQNIFVWKGRNVCCNNCEQPSGMIILLDSVEKSISEYCTLTDEGSDLNFPLNGADLQGNELDVRFISLGKTKASLPDLCFPYKVYDSLFLHQRECIRWMWNLHYRNTPGMILADDMGLGKTRQVTAFLSGMLHSRIIERALVVAPSSVVEQWIPEFQKVGINNAQMFRSAKDNQALSIIQKKGGILITTHGVFKRNQPQISGRVDEKWDYIFVDEGHRAKGKGTQLCEALKRMKCSHKVIITGTPIQNNLEELFTLMEICDPEVLGCHENFMEDFIKPINRGKYRNATLYEKLDSSEALTNLKEKIGSVVLRRPKALLKELGIFKAVKSEYIIWIKLTDLQRALYEELVLDPLRNSKGGQFAAVQVAREISRHSFLLEEGDISKRPHKVSKSSEDKNISEEGNISFRLKLNLLKKIPLHSKSDVEISNKLNFICYMVPKFLEEGHKILIFSQSPQMLKYIKNGLKKVTTKKIIRMDGKTKSCDREMFKKCFQGDDISAHSPGSSGSSSSSTGSPSSGSSGDSRCLPQDPPWVFLMTTQVGGVGLNLTKATRVILVDPSYNPSDDSQAVDRAYRVGQDKDVIVFRLISCADNEENIYRTQVMKGESSSALLEDNLCMRQISKVDGLVLKVPPCGFDYCETHHELMETYPEFNISPAALDISHESVVAIGNHSLLFSKAEEQAVQELLKDRVKQLKNESVEEDEMVEEEPVKKKAGGFSDAEFYAELFADEK